MHVDMCLKSTVGAYVCSMRTVPTQFFSCKMRDLVKDILAPFEPQNEDTFDCSND